MATYFEYLWRELTINAHIQIFGTRNSMHERVSIERYLVIC